MRQKSAFAESLSWRSEFSFGVDPPVCPGSARILTSCPPAKWLCVENSEIEFAEAIRFRDHVDGDDLPAGDGEAHDGQRPSLCRDDDSGGPVDQRLSGERGK